MSTYLNHCQPETKYLGAFRLYSEPELAQISSAMNDLVIVVRRIAFGDVGLRRLAARLVILDEADGTMILLSNSAVHVNNIYMSLPILCTEFERLSID